MSEILDDVCMYGGMETIITETISFIIQRHLSILNLAILIPAHLTQVLNWNFWLLIISNLAGINTMCYHYHLPHSLLS